MNTLDVKPCITSYWQTSGRSDTTFAKKADLGLDYIRDRSVLADLKLMAKTIDVVITARALNSSFPELVVAGC